LDISALHAHAGRFDEARSCLDCGEALLRPLSDRVSLAILLCKRAETECLPGIVGAAKAAFDAAGACALHANAGADSERGLALARVRNLLAQKSLLGSDGADGAATSTAFPTVIFLGILRNILRERRNP